MANISASNLLDTIRNNNNKYTYAYSKNVRVADDDVEDFQEKFTEFRKIVRRLSNYSSNDTTEDKLKDYLSDFADTYNSMVENRDKITDSSLNDQLDSLDTLIDNNIKSLKKLGLKRNDDGELEFDEDTFDDDYDQKVVDKLFTGTDSFIDKARKLMRKIDKSADSAHVVTTERHVSATTKYSDADFEKAENYSVVQTWGKVLNDVYNQYSNHGENDTEDYTDYLKEDSLASFIAEINQLGDDDIIKLFKDSKYTDSLSKLGITYDETNQELNYSPTKKSNSTIDNTSEKYYVDTLSYDNLFNNSEDSFAAKLIALCKSGFDNTLKTSTIGVSIDSYDYCTKIDETV